MTHLALMAKSKMQKKLARVFSREQLLNSEYLAGLIVVLISAAVFMWRLSSLTSNLISAQELTTKHQLFTNSPWWKSVANLNGPYYLLLHGTFAISRSVWDLRLASVVIGVLAALGIYFLVSRWHGFKIGFLSTLVFITNLGILATARQASSLIAQALIVSLLLIAIVLIYELKNFWGLLALIVIGVGSLYFSGAIYLVMATAILTYAPIK